MQIEVVRGDITTQDVDAVVNAANATLLGGGGVDGALHTAAGPQLLEACRRLRRTTYPDGLPVGDAVVTPGFALPARWVVHTVGPNWHRGQRDRADLVSCFARSLERAVEVGASSIAFPAISAGAYGWDVEVVADVAIRTVRTWEAGAEPADERGHTHPVGIGLVRFVLFSAPAFDAFRRALDAPQH